MDGSASSLSGLVLGQFADHSLSAFTLTLVRLLRTALSLAEWFPFLFHAVAYGT